MKHRIDFLSLYGQLALFQNLLASFYPTDYTLCRFSQHEKFLRRSSFVFITAWCGYFLKWMVVLHSRYRVICTSLQGIDFHPAEYGSFETVPGISKDPVSSKLFTMYLVGFFEASLWFDWLLKS